MISTRSRAPFGVLLGLLLALGCDEKEAAAPAVEKSAEQKKQETVEALLRESGIDPSTIGSATAGSGAPPATAPGTSADAASKAAPSTSPQGPAGAAAVPKQTIELVSAGAGPKQQLRYKFEKDAVRNFTMDMVVSPKRSVNGQPVPGMPAVQIGMSGTTKTLAFSADSVMRETTFLKFTPGAEGLPPEMVAQMQAQFDALKGIKVLETVSLRGQILNMQVSQESMGNPQVLALLQNLQDGMTNSYLPLPEEEVGVGAKWKGTTRVETAGLAITQVSHVTLKSLVGDKAVVDLSFEQSAPAQRIQSPELPPDTVVELTGMKGGGKGSMTVNFATLETESKVDLSMTVDTRIQSPQEPAPVLSSTDTGMKIHMRVTK